MGAAPLNWLLKIGGETLKTTAKTLSEAVNTLHDSVINLSTTVTNLGTSKADASTTTTALNNLETSKLNVSDLLSLEEIEASTSLTGKGVTAESVKSLNSSLGSLRFGYDETNKKYGYYVTDSEGADTFYPFSSGKKVKSVTFKQNIWTTHSQPGTGSSTFTLTITVNFTDAEVPAVSSISASGFQKVGNYELKDYGRTVTGITYY